VFKLERCVCCPSREQLAFGFPLSIWVIEVISIEKVSNTIYFLSAECNPVVIVYRDCYLVMVQFQPGYRGGVICGKCVLNCFPSLVKNGGKTRRVDISTRVQTVSRPSNSSSWEM
jgi:hypothetical protein